MQHPQGVERRHLLYIVTSEENMGDLALCMDWVASLGRRRYRHAFVLGARLRPYVDPADRCFVFERAVPVGHTIVAAAREVGADAVILATNSFWNLPGQAGAEFGRYPPQLADLPCPLLSFDLYEGAISTSLPGTEVEVVFPSVPPSVIALRYYSTGARPGDNARHFRLPAAAADLADTRRQVFQRLRLDPERKLLLFPVSRDRHQAIRARFPLYYPYLSTLLAALPAERVQVLLLTPEPMPEFGDNVLQLPCGNRSEEFIRRDEEVMAATLRLHLHLHQLIAHLRPRRVFAPAGLAGHPDQLLLFQAVHSLRRTAALDCAVLLYEDFPACRDPLRRQAFQQRMAQAGIALRPHREEAGTAAAGRDTLLAIARSRHDPAAAWPADAAEHLWELTEPWT